MRQHFKTLCERNVSQPNRHLLPERTAEALGVTAMTVSRACEAPVLEGMEAFLQRKPQPACPTKLDRAAQAELARLACSTPPPGRARWTLKLLAAELVSQEVVDALAPETVRRALKKRIEIPAAEPADALDREPDS